MKKFVAFLFATCAFLSTQAVQQALLIKGYRIGESGIIDNDGRIVVTNVNNESSTSQLYVSDTRLSSNAFFHAAIPDGQSITRWVEYNRDPSLLNVNGIITNVFAGAGVEDYTWSYNSTDTASRWFVVDYDYITYNLSYNGNGGNGSIPSESHVYTNEFTLAANTFTRTGYTFDGWTNAVVTTPLADAVSIASGSTFGVTYTNKSTTLYVKWQPHIYTVHFEANTTDGVSGKMDDQAMTYGVPDNLTSNAFVRQGYRFKGWSMTTDGGAVYGDGQSVSSLTSEDKGVVNLYAFWEAKKFSIRYHRNDGSDATSVQDNQSFGNPVKIISITGRAGYVLEGWATSAGGDATYESGQEYSIDPGDSDVIHLYAVWTPKQYTIKFKPNGGTGEMDDVDAVYDEIYTLPECKFTKAGVSFTGWSTNTASGAVFHFGDSVSNLTTRANATVIFYAIWSEPRYIAFSANDADNAEAMSEDVMTFEGVETKALVANKFEKTGYTFAGWATNDIAAAALNIAYTNCENVVSTNLWMDIGETNVLCAVWQTNTYTVVFNANGGTGSMEDQVFHYDREQALAKCIFESNLSFMGWATNQAGGVVFENEAEISNLTAVANGVVPLYAIWDNGELSRAMHCNNLVWVQEGDDGRTPWEVSTGVGEGYEASGSLISNLVGWAVGKYTSYTLKPSSESSGKGKLSFYYKTSSADSYNYFYFNNSQIESSTEWKLYGPVDIEDITEVSIQFGAHQNLGDDSYSVWIDQMTWTPEGPDQTEDTETVNFVCQNALVNNEERNEPYFDYDGGIKRGHASPKVTFTAEQSPMDGILFDAWELTLGDAVYGIEGNPLVLDGNATCFAETTNSTCYVRAKFKWLEYRIDYDANDGHGTVTPDSSSYIYTNEVELAAATPSAGYSFAGWTTNATEGTMFAPGAVVNGADLGATASGLVTLYANWTQNVYSVTFCYTNSEGAAASTQRTVLGTESAEPPDSSEYDSLPGYKFVEWDAGYSNVVSDVTVNALYEEEQSGGGGDPGEDPGPAVVEYYVIAFDANGGECEEDSRNVKCGEPVGDLPEAVRDNYTFGGWFTADDTEVVPATVPVTNATYYAKWSFDGLVVTGSDLKFEVKEAVQLSFGECFVVESVSNLKTITVSGLPSGVKFDAKTRTFSGAPTKAGLFYVTCVVKNDSGYQYSCTAVWNVGNAPSPDNDNGGIGDEVLAQLNGLVTGYAYELAGFGNATAITGLPTGLKFNKAVGVISGIPTKPGKATVTFTGANKAKSVKTIIVVDGGMHALELIASPVNSVDATGTTAGGGVYAVGKKVTIRATAAKGCVFAGWRDDNGEPLVGSADFRTASFPYEMGDTKTTLIAAFAMEDEDKDSLRFVNVTNVTTEANGSLELDLGACLTSLSLPKLSVTGLPTGLKYDAKTLKVSGEAKKPGVYTVKVAATNTSVKKATEETTTTFKIAVPNFECDALPHLQPETNAYDTVRSGVALDPGLVNCMPVDAGWTVKATGLPTGLKLVQDKTTKAYSITGVSTAKAGSYTVTFTASKKGEKSQVATITLNVETLPEWAVGTFDGGVLSTADESGDVLGLAQGIAVAANGKVSGKLIDGDGTWAISAASFDRYDTVRGEYVATVIGKSGKMAFTNELVVSSEPFEGSLRGRAGMIGEGVKVEAVQNLWKTAAWKAVAIGFANKKLSLGVEGVVGAFTSGAIELKFASSGTVTAAGKFVTGVNEKTSRDIVYSASCTSVLIPEGEDLYTVFVYFPLKKDAKGNVKFAGYADEISLEWNGSNFVQRNE